MIHLIVNTYEDPHPQRNEELRYCLYKNEQLMIALGGEITTVTGRPTFDEMLAYSKAGVINAIINSDVHLDHTAQLLATVNWSTPTVVALAKWDLLPNGRLELCNRPDSQDLWAYYGVIEQIGLEHSLGVAGVDNKAAYLFKEKGYKIINPALSIKAIHVHNSGVRNYLNDDHTKIFRIPPPYHRIIPHRL